MSRKTGEDDSQETDIAGVDWDAPARILTIKPFVPWEDFDYSGLSLGSLRLDLNYHNNSSGAEIALKHNQARIDELKLIIRAPVGTKNCKIVKSSTDCKLSSGKPYYGKPTWDVLIKDLSKSWAAIELEWH